MPAVSDAQRKFLYATKGEAWVRRHHFDNKGKLPQHVAANPFASALSKRAKKAKGKR